ncbi:MAG: hypothetical protein RLZZ127_131 [Planctomycetota bacterium]|jgi:hypothetical protein
MSKGAALDERLIQALGLGEQLFTLKGPVVNGYHPILGDPMFALRTKETEEILYLERKYVFDNQVSVKTNMGEGERLLLWIVRQARPNPKDPAGPPVVSLYARECFFLSDWREFQRFKLFLKSMRILDAQARQWLEDHHKEFPALAVAADGIERILTNLSRISELPDLEGGGQKKDGIERLAKTYSVDLLPVRSSPLLPAMLLRRDRQERFVLFRLFSHVEDPSGAASLVAFLTAMAYASGDKAATEAVKGLTGARELARALTTLRTAILRADLGAA